MGDSYKTNAKMRNASILVGKPDGKNNFGDLGVGRRILGKWGVKMWNGFNWFRIKPSGRML
jgi:hypothetical protein